MLNPHIESLSVIYDLEPLHFLSQVIDGVIIKKDIK